MGSELSFQGYYHLAKRNWRMLAAVSVGAIVLSAVFSGPTFIKPRYRSSAIVYPVNLTTYSIETRTDQLLQLVESNSIRDSLIKKFDLARHYDIDTTEPAGYFYLYSEFSDRVEISKTRYESVQIEIVDEDPRRARDMVQELLDQTDLLARRLQREKSEEVLLIAQRELGVEKRKLDSVEARLSALRAETGLLNYDAQTEEVTRGYMRMLASPGTPSASKEEARSMLKALGEKGGEFRYLTDLSNMFRGNYVGRLNEYEKARMDVEKELTYTNMIQYPEISDKKVFPVRWLIVLLTTASAFFLAFLLLVWREQQRS
ncbi:MAG: hypothetical protein KDB88_10575 [Flavobacteriales bacterium]|nr:hypothetical protein [Flavobacteriales bacterium]